MNWYKITLRERDKEKFEFILKLLNINQNYQYVEEKNNKISCFLFLSGEASRNLYLAMRNSIKKFRFIKVG